LIGAPSTAKDEKCQNEQKDGDDDSLRAPSRCNFVALSLAAGLGAATRSAPGKQLPLVEIRGNFSPSSGVFQCHP